MSLASSALADGPGYRSQGVFEGSGEGSLSLLIILLERRIKEPDIYAASFVTAAPNCAGDVGMIGRSVGPRRLEFSRKDDVTGQECAISVSFDPTFKKATMSEGECPFHGAACAFEGKLKRVY